MAVRSTTLALENLESRLNLSTLAGANFLDAFGRTVYSQERAQLSTRTKLISLGAAAKSATAMPLSALAGAASPAPAVSVSATTKSITVAWVNNSSNDTGFHIYRSTDGVNFKLLTNVAATKSAYTDTTATLGVSYIYRVTAYNKSSATASGASRAVALALPPAPSAPSSLVDSKSTQTAISLSWKDNATNETGYHVYRSTDGQNYTLIASLKPSAKSYTDTKLQPGTTYFYEVSAWNAGGETYAPTPFTAATLAAPPVAPTNLAFSNVSGSGATLQWNEASTDVSGYRIYRSSNGKTFNLVGNVDDNTDTFTDTALNPLSTYSYEVSAWNSSANVLSKAASVSTLMAAPNAPGSLAFTNVTTDSLTLSWTSTSTSQTSFNIYRAVDGDTSAPALVGTVDGATFQFNDTGLNAGTTYDYTVAAVNAGGQGLSVAASAMTNAPTPAPSQTAPTTPVTTDPTIPVTTDPTVPVTTDPTTPVVVAPAAPFSVHVSGATTSSLTVNWADDGTQTGVRIYRSTDATNFTDVADLSAGATSWTDSNLTAGTRYFYKIGSWNSAGETDTSAIGASTLAAVTTPSFPAPPVVVAPNAPASVTFSGINTTAATVNWSASTGETGYKIYRTVDGVNYTLVGTTNSTTTSWTDSTLNPNTLYAYEISAFNTAGETKSQPASVSTLVAAPNSPGSLTFTNVTTTAATLNWSAPVAGGGGQTGFHVYRSTDGTNYTLVGTLSANATTWTDPTLAANTTYDYVVGAFNSTGEAATSAAPVSTLVAAPNAPATIAFTNVTTSGVTLNWSATTGETGYNVYRTVDGVNYSLVATTNATTTSWTDSGLNPNSLYAYEVSAFNTTGETKSQPASVSTLVAAPNSPGSLTFTNITTTAATLNWNAPAAGGQTGFHVYRSTNGTNYTLVGTLAANATTWTDSTLAAGSTYYYAVGAFNTTGESTTPGAAVSTLVVAPNAPATVTFTNVTTSGDTVNWSAATGETGYHVYRTVDGVNYSLVATTSNTATNWTDSGLNAGTTYAYEVSAFNTTGENKSQPASVSTLVASPNSPGAVTFTNVTTTAATLNWSAPTAGGQTGYHIYRSTNGTTYTLVGTLAANATTWTDTTLAAGSSYSYEVGAFNTTGESKTPAASVSTLVAVPNAPATVAFTNVTTTGVTVNWSAVSGETGYHVYRTVDGANYTLVATTSSTSTTWTDSGLNPNTLYAYEVSAFNTTGEAKSQPASVSTLVVAPNAPASLSFTNVTTTAATLNWSASGGQTGYHVYRSTNGTNYTLVGTLAANATTWTDTTLASGTTYSYEVGAFNTTGESTTPGASVSTLVAAPNAPASIAFTNVTTSGLTLNWSAAAGETGYHVYRTIDGTNYSLVATTNSTTTTWTDSALTAGTTYAYEVSAFNTTGETKSQPASVSTLVAIPNSPGSLTFTNITTTAATLNWSAPGGQTGFHVYRSTNGTNYTLVGTLAANATTWTDSTLASGTTYSYEVGAFNTTGEAATPAASVSTLVAAPTNVTFTNLTTTGLTLNWSASANSTGYHIYRSTDGTNFTLVGTLTAATTTWTDSGLTSGSTYYYSVGAFNTGGETRTATASASTLVAAPNAPGTPTFTNVTTTGLTLNWSATANTTGYHIYRSTDGTNYTLVSTIAAGTTTFTDSGLSSGTAYFYEVGAYNTGGEAKSAAATTSTQAVVVAGNNATFSTLNQTSFTELDITGTSGNDTIVVTESGNVLTIVANGNTTTEPTSFGDIKIYGVNGNDTITVQSSVNIATLIYGGDGNDIINNLTTGKATIVTIGNGVNTVTGNGINTSYWVNPGDTVHASAAEIALGGVNKVAGFYENVSRNLYGQNLTDPTDSGAETRLTNSSFWGTGPSMNDINQTSLSDCYFEAPLAALAYSEPQRLMNMGVDLGDGTYAVRFYNDFGIATYVRVDGDLSTGGWNYGLNNQTPGADGNQWGSIFEKAYAFFRSGANSYSSLNYGYQGQTYTDLGLSSSATFPSSPANMLSTVNTQLAAGHAIVASTNSSITSGTPIVGSHCYTILGAYMNNGTLMIQMRNPWGVDGFNDDSNPNDGLVTVAYSVFTADFSMVSWTTV